MNKIIFAKNLLGIKEVKEDISEIVSKAKAGDQRYQYVAMYIAQALDYLNDITIPEKENSYLLHWDTTDFWKPDRFLTFTIVKKVTSQPSVFEFRINWHPIYFRALFFVEDIDQEQYKFLTRSLIKKEKNPPELQQKIGETELTSKMYRLNPAKFLKEWSK